MALIQLFVDIRFQVVVVVVSVVIVCNNEFGGVHSSHAGFSELMVLVVV